MRNKHNLDCRFGLFNTYKPNKVIIWLPRQSMKAFLYYSRNKKSFGPTHQPHETLQRPSLNCNIRWKEFTAICRPIFCVTLKRKTAQLPFSLYTIQFPRKNKICGHSLTLRAYAKSLSILISSFTACFQEHFKALLLADKQGKKQFEEILTFS